MMLLQSVCSVLACRAADGGVSSIEAALNLDNKVNACTFIFFLSCETLNIIVKQRCRPSRFHSEAPKFML